MIRDNYFGKEQQKNKMFPSLNHFKIDQQIEQLKCLTHIEQIKYFQIRGNNVKITERSICDQCLAFNCISIEEGLIFLEEILKENSIKNIIEKVTEDMDKLLCNCEKLNESIMQIYECQKDFIQQIKQHKQLLQLDTFFNDITITHCNIIGELISENSLDLKQKNIFSYIKQKLKPTIIQNLQDSLQHFKKVSTYFKQFQKEYKQLLQLSSRNLMQNQKNDDGEIICKILDKNISPIKTIQGSLDDNKNKQIMFLSINLQTDQTVLIYKNIVELRNDEIIRSRFILQDYKQLNRYSMHKDLLYFITGNNRQLTVFTYNNELNVFIQQDQIETPNEGCEIDSNQKIMRFFVWQKKEIFIFMQKSEQNQEAFEKTQLTKQKNTNSWEIVKKIESQNEKIHKFISCNAKLIAFGEESLNVYKLKCQKNQQFRIEESRLKFSPNQIIAHQQPINCISFFQEKENAHQHSQRIKPLCFWLTFEGRIFFLWKLNDQKQLEKTLQFELPDDLQKNLQFSLKKNKFVLVEENKIILITFYSNEKNPSLNYILVKTKNKYENSLLVIQNDDQVTYLQNQELMIIPFCAIDKDYVPRIAKKELSYGKILIKKKI